MSTRASVREFLQHHHATTSAAWRSQIADRCRGSDAWPDPWQIAARLGLDVLLIDCAGFRFAPVGSVIYVGKDDDKRVMGHRIATAIAQHLLELSNAHWSRDDVFLLAFELLMPSASVRATAPSELARCQPHVFPALVETWAEHVSSAR